MRPRMTKASYREYLQSPHWKKVSGEARRRARYRCQECGARGVRLEVHHLSYKNLGDERPEELQALCRACHEDKRRPRATTWDAFIREWQDEWEAARKAAPPTVEERLRPYAAAEAVRQAPGGLEKWIGKVVLYGDWARDLTATVEGAVAGKLVGTDEAGEIVILQEKEIVAIIKEIGTSTC